MRTITTKPLAVLLALTAALGCVSCSSVDDGDYVDPITLSEKIGGRWVVNSVIQTDETNAKTMTLTDLLDFDTFVINFDRDASGNPSTFSIEGNAPALLPQKGTWKMDYNFTKSDATASQILLTGSDQPVSLTVTTLPGNNQTLEYKLVRKVNGQPFVSYSYNLTKAE